MSECSEIVTVSQGYSLDEAVENFKEATELYMEELPISEKSKTYLTTFELADA